MQKIRNQIRKLYLSSVTGNLSLTGAWVAILAARGYSLSEIGLAETVFHITSILLEIPSGVFADLFGRKKMLLVSSILRMAGNVVMIFSCNLPMVCTALAFYAASYNFASSADEALAYDSLKLAGRESDYEKYASNQMILYRLCSGISTLCAGFALFIGHRAAYGTDVVMCVLQILIVLSLYEARVSNRSGDGFDKLTQSVKAELIRCFLSSLSFLKKERKAVALMFCNSFVGAADILLLFFLQAKLPAAGMPGQALGAALFFMEMGGILGARVILKWKKSKYGKVFALTAALVLAGILMEHSGICLVMTFGGFLAAFADDTLQVRTNAILQDMFPSEQRATLISIESFTFSVIMVVLSPLAGFFFSWW
ncbi:MAG: MFS transporter [Bacteroidales bacterium]|nr:MFS transporter [Bacteroidales bacterium]MCM1414923.1 MFS transporter [bacterium]MCM1423071.1 MFS transporter [bacterium]